MPFRANGLLRGFIGCGPKSAVGFSVVSKGFGFSFCRNGFSFGACHPVDPCENMLFGAGPNGFFGGCANAVKVTISQ